MFSEASLHSVHGGKQADLPPNLDRDPCGRKTNRPLTPMDRDPMDIDPSGQNMGPDRK